MAVTCNSSLGRTMIPEDSPLMPCLHNIEDAAHRAALLCSQMLAYAGKEQVTLREVELRRLCARRGAPARGHDGQECHPSCSIWPRICRPRRPIPASFSRSS
ncbi:MAG: hypothetical protein WDN28_05880 [Chthoniobacter sp.]